MQDREERNRAVELIAGLVHRPESAIRLYLGCPEPLRQRYREGPTLGYELR
jgi:hypothetical protein